VLGKYEECTLLFFNHTKSKLYFEASWREVGGKINIGGEGRVKDNRIISIME
jgi:hypothetical protein